MNTVTQYINKHKLFCYLLYLLSQEEEYLINGSRKAAMNGSVPHKRHHDDHNYDYDSLEVTENTFKEVDEK